MGHKMDYMRIFRRLIRKYEKLDKRTKERLEADVALWQGESSEELLRKGSLGGLCYIAMKPYPRVERGIAINILIHALGDDDAGRRCVAADTLRWVSWREPDLLRFEMVFEPKLVTMLKSFAKSPDAKVCQAAKSILKCRKQ